MLCTVYLQPSILTWWQSEWFQHKRKCWVCWRREKRTCRWWKMPLRIFYSVYLAELFRRRTKRWVQQKHPTHIYHDGPVWCTYLCHDEGCTSQSLCSIGERWKGKESARVSREEQTGEPLQPEIMTSVLLPQRRNELGGLIPTVSTQLSVSKIGFHCSLIQVFRNFSFK